MFKLKRFAADCKGNTTVMLALAIVPLLFAAGSAIDMVKTNQTMTVLQGAADAAALAGASSIKLYDEDDDDEDDDKLQRVVEDYLKANGAIDILASIEKIEPKLDKKGRTFSVRVKGARKTSLMFLAGIDEVKLDTYSEVKIGGDGLEVALVLDSTGSMNAAGRMPALKTAAKDLVDDLLKVKEQGGYVKVGIVPFAEYVNVGLSRRNQSWISVPNDSASSSHSCWNTYPNATKSNCQQLPSYADGVPTGGTYEHCDWDYGDPVQQCGNTTSESKWHGCVGSRPDPLDAAIGNLSTKYPGLMDTWCNAEIEELTHDKSDLHGKINSLSGSGNTYIPAGLLWGWNMVDSNEPLKKAKTKSQLAAMGGTKAIVLMTDGENTLSASYPQHWGNNRAAADAKTTELCNNIKGDDIVVYTVSFMVTDTGAQNMLKNCASDPGKAFTADDANQLKQAFKEIGSSLMALRISK
jgi:Flp pilus assembly protein TadG